MISWFRDRLKNQRPWFKYTNGITESIEGQKVVSGLVITVKFRGEWVSITMDKDSVYKFKEWINRTYPGGTVNNVVNFKPTLKLATELPVPPAPRDPDPNIGPVS